MQKRKKILSVLLIVFAVILTLGMSVTADAKKKKKKKMPSLAKAKVTLSKKSYTYNGKAKKPSVTVKVGKKKLKKSRDYKVSYSKNKKVGKAKVTLKAKKNCKGKKTASFTIKKASRTLVPGKTAYTAVVGDADFSMSARTSKGGGAITYSCSTTNVIKVTSAGRVSVVAAGTAKVTIKVAATSSYKAASVTVPVTISKKPVRAVDTVASIKNFNYPSLQYACTTKKLTDLSWNVVSKYSLPGLGPTLEDDLAKGYIKCNNLCPQGICFAGDYMLTTAYCMDEVHPSCIFIYNRKTGEYLKTLELTKKSHVGGITFDGSNVWICHSDSYDLQRIPYSLIAKYAVGAKGCVSYNPDELELTSDDDTGMHGITTKPSAIAYNPNDGFLWVTQFKSKAESTMVAYQYKDGVLKAVTKYLNTKEQDFLGIETVEATKEACEAVQVVSGAAVSVVHSGGPGAKAGLQEGDILVELDGKKLSSKEDVTTILSTHKAGDKVKIKALRANPTAVSGTNAVIVISKTLTLGTRVTKKATRIIPPRVQGVTFTTTGKAVFSISYGRNRERALYDSELMVYKANWDNVYDDATWEPILAVALPPMVEEVEVNGDEIYMLFESAAMTYLEGTDNVDKDKSECPIDRIVSVKLNVD